MFSVEAMFTEVAFTKSDDAFIFGVVSVEDTIVPLTAFWAIRDWVVLSCWHGLGSKPVEVGWILGLSDERW